MLRLVNAHLPEDLPWPEYQRLIKRRFNHLANQQVRGERTRIPERYREAVVEEPATGSRRALAELRATTSSATSTTWRSPTPRSAPDEGDGVRAGGRRRGDADA